MSIHVAAIDLGATSGRVMRAVVSADSIDMIEVARFPNGPVERADGLHWDIEALRRHVMAGLRQAFVDDPRITSIGIDSWAVDYALLREGRMLGEPFHYRDGRTARGVAAVHAVVPPDELYSANGLQHLPFNTVFQLAAESPERLAEADTMLLIPDLFGYWLTGRAVAETTNASTTGLVDPRTGAWNEALIARLRMPRHLLPQLVQPGEVIGALTPAAAAELGAPDGVVVTAVGSHDTASAVVAVPMTRADAAYISCGTWGLVGLELEQPVVTEAAREADFTNEAGIDGRVRFLHNVMGLWLLSETFRTWELEGAPVELGRMLARAAAVTDHVPVFDVGDARLLPPGDMPGRISRIIAEAGGTPPTEQSAFVRCILESIAEGFTDSLRDAVALTSREVGVVHLVGGGALNSLLCQLLADRVGVPVHAGPVEATAIGNALVQARSHGLAGSLDGLRSLVAGTQQIQLFAPRLPAAT